MMSKCKYRQRGYQDEDEAGAAGTAEGRAYAAGSSARPTCRASSTRFGCTRCGNVLSAEVAH